jgi:serine/threonine protein kinase
MQAARGGSDFLNIAMECVAGKSLDQWIPRKGLRLNQALKRAIQTADALAKVHAAGIVHRDLKPSNIRIGESDQVKLVELRPRQAFGTGGIWRYRSIIVASLFGVSHGSRWPESPRRTGDRWRAPAQACRSD